MKRQMIWKGLLVYFAFIAIIMQGDKVFAANDSFTNATSISVNKVVTDRMAYTSSTDYNYYKFTINGPGYVNLNFSHAEEESMADGWNITLYDANKEVIKSISSKRSQSNVISNNIGLPAGTYYVRVDNQYCSESTLNYQLKVNYVASSNWETEFNDDFLNADNITVNKSVIGSMMYNSSKDYDYYKFIIDSSGFVSLSFSHAEEEPVADGWNITLYDVNRNGIKSFSSKRSQSNVISNNIGLPAGTYYIKVDNQYCSESTIDYQLKVNYTASNSWETEFNDSFLTADGIAVNQIVNGSMMYNSSKDYDYYKFTITAQGYINLSFSHAEGESVADGWNITLYDANQEGIKSISSKISHSNIISNNIGLPAGTYYVRVDNQYCSESTVDYQLIVNYVQENNWETEFNDGFTTADTLLAGQTIYGSMMYSNSIDYDYYKVNLNKTGYVNISFQHAKLENESDSWNVCLYDANRNFIKRMSVCGHETSKSIGKMYLGQGSYYVVINNEYCATKNIDYKLKVYYTTPKASIKTAKSKSSKTAYIKWKKLKGVTGYEMVTATNKKFNKNKKVTTINKANKTSTTVKKLKRKKTYYVKMRGFVVVDGQKYYGSYSAVKKVKVK